VPLKRALASLGLSLALLGCQPSSDEPLRADPAAGQALVVALEVSQVAHATAESVAALPAAGCRPTLICPLGPVTITTSVTLRRQEPAGTAEAVERSVWSRDGSGNVSIDFQTSTPAAAGAQSKQQLALRRIGEDRFGALDGRFVKATVAPLLDERLAADPQAALDSLFALAKADDGTTPRCAVAPAALPGRLETATAELSADRRSLRLTVALPTGRSLEVEVNEQVACTAETITAPLAAEAVEGFAPAAALNAFLTEGKAQGWLLPAPPLEAPRR
jgi:hypothetical protein